MKVRLEEAFDGGETTDEDSFTDESDVDVFLEYAREVIAENNLSYDSTSFSEFEDLLQQCVANHFLDSNEDNNSNNNNNTNDSLTSEFSYSGYLNENSDHHVNRKDMALSQPKGIMSDNAYHRMKGIIARKKTASTSAADCWNSEEMGDTSTSAGTGAGTGTCTTSTGTSQQHDHDHDHNVDANPPRNQSRSDGTRSDDMDLMLSRMNSVPIFPRRYDSDSCDSVVDKKTARQIRREKNRRRSRNKKKLRGESIHQDCTLGSDAHPHPHPHPNRPPNDRLSLLLQSPTNKEKALRFLSEHAPGLRDSVLARLDRASDERKLQSKAKPTRHSSSSTSVGLEIETNNTILPSLVKKGIVYFDIPRIERALGGKKQKIDAMNKKQNVLNQLFDKFASEEKSERKTTQKGMASLHKLRARKKVALQATFLRYSAEREHPQSKQSEKSPKKLSTPSEAKDELSSTWKSVQFELDPTGTRVRHEDPLEFQESAFSTSCVSEKLSLKNLLDKRKRSLAHSMKSPDTECLLQRQRQITEQHRKHTDHDEEPVSKTMLLPLRRIVFFRPKGDGNHGVLSPDSSITNDVSSDLDHFSSYVETTTTENDDGDGDGDGAQVESSDDSAWSEMSFQSDPHRFASSSVATLIAKGKLNLGSQKYHPFKPLPIETKSPETFNDSFDDIVLRNTPKLGGKKSLDGFGAGQSPTGVADIFNEPKGLLLKGAHIHDALAFVDDDDDGDHVFTDKDDSFGIKSLEQGEIYSAYNPVFFSPRRFEI